MDTVVEVPLEHADDGLNLISLNVGLILEALSREALMTLARQLIVPAWMSASLGPWHALRFPAALVAPPGPFDLR